ncbi:hypothetical protein KFU94_23910 [Chloroflexi bacterium TSY]|nr:hypothetical protein [Chloroflexi bacterium TSY]
MIHQSLQNGDGLFDSLDRLEQTADGYPKEGQYTIENQDGNIVRWDVAGYEVLYERLTKNRYLLMAALKRNR